LSPSHDQQQSDAAAASATSAENSAQLAGIVVGLLAVLVSVGLGVYIVRLLRRVFGRLSAVIPRLNQATIEMRTSIQEAAAATSASVGGLCTRALARILDLPRFARHLMACE
jgi:flagellar biogenesis protein FliO